MISRQVFTLPLKTMDWIVFVDADEKGVPAPVPTVAVAPVLPHALPP